MRHTQPAQALIHAEADARGRKVEVPGVRAVTADFGGEEEFLARNFAQGLAEEGLCLGGSEIGRGIQTIDAQIDRLMDRADAILLLNAAKGLAEGRGALAQHGNFPDRKSTRLNSSHVSES